MGVTVQNVMNVSALTGQLLVAFQGVVCVSVAIACLVTGGMVVGDKNRDRVSAVALSREDILYMYNGQTYTAKLVPVSGEAYQPGETVHVLVNPSKPTDVLEDLNWTVFGSGMMVCGLAMVALTWYAVKIVNERQNVAAFAGIFTALGALLGL